MSFTKGLYWKSRFLSCAKIASMKLSVLCCLRQFSSHTRCLPCTDFIHPCMEYASHVWGGSTNTALLNRMESKAFCLINSPPLTVFFLSNTTTILLLCPSSTTIFMVTDLLNLLTACLPQPCCTRLSTLHSYSVHLSSLSLANSGTLCLILFSTFIQLALLILKCTQYQL